MSVVVPTFRDWDRLAKCVVALQRQTYPAHLVEVLIVNNDPNDPPPTALVVGPNVRLLTEASPGSYAARNAGIEAAAGQIIAFTDADCIPDPRWIEAAVHELKAGAERVAGHIELFAEAARPSLADEYELLVGFDQASYAAQGSAATANMVTWARHFTAVGPFDAGLLSGGDMEWGIRAYRHGIGIRYMRSSVVRHPTRGSLDALFKKARRVAGGRTVLSTLRNERFSVLRGLLPPKSAIAIARASHLTVMLRVRLLAVAYALKLWNGWHALMIALGLATPERN